MRHALVLATTLLSIGCASVTRHALPAELVDEAVVPGFPHVRAWTLSQDRRFHEDFVAALRTVRTATDQARPLDLHVLCLSGGGDAGAFGAGVLVGWTDSGKRPEFAVVTGISTGALMAPFAFVGKERDAELERLYTAVDAGDIYDERSWFNVFSADSIADTAPLAKMLGEVVDDRLLADVAREHARGRRLYVGTTNLDAQRLVVWDMGAIASTQREGAAELFRQVLLASASIPVVFPPQYVEVEAAGETYDEMHVDGGVRVQVFLPVLLIDPLTAVTDAGFAEGELRWHVHVLRNGTLARAYEPIEPSTMSIAGRAFATSIQSQAYGDLVRFLLTKERYDLDIDIAALPDDYARVVSDEFDRSEMRRMFDIGRGMGAAGAAFEPLTEEQIKRQQRSTVVSEPAR